MKMTMQPDLNCPAMGAESFPMLEDPRPVYDPERDSAEIRVPDVITVHTWFFRRYRVNMYAALNGMLRSGELGRIAGRRILNQRISRENCEFTGARFYDNGRDSFLADIKTQIRIETERGPEVFRGVLTYVVRAEQGRFSAEVLDFSAAEEEREMTALSPFLIPYVKNQDMDRVAESMWSRYLPEALGDPRLRRGEQLARRMGLRVRYEPVCGPEGTDSLLFFADGEIDIRDEGSPAERMEPPRRIRIEGGTVVVNTNRVKREHADYAIFHECIHYERHFLFFSLQNVWSNDPRRFKTRTVKVRERDRMTDPFYWMERQANRGAYGLMMPAGDTLRIIREEIGAAPEGRNRGELMENVIRSMRRRLGWPYFRIRARMIQMGYPEAKGAMNFVDGHWIEPFAFQEDSLMREETTYVISREETERMREEFPGFREILDSGAYVYADGHVVRADQTRRGCLGIEVMTEEAARRADRYCLRFVRVYEQRGGRYVPGRVHYDADYARRTAFFLADTVNSRQLDELDAREAYIREFPQDFKEAFDLVMHQNGMTREGTAEAMNLTPKTLYRMLREPEKYISRDFVVMLALVWQMPDWLTELMLDRAGLMLRSGDRRHRALQYIIRVMWMDGVEKANKYLRDVGVANLMV